MDELEEEAESGSGSGGSSKKKPILFVLLALTAVILWMGLTEPPVAEPEPEETYELIREGPEPLANPLYMDLGTMIINLQGGQYFLKATIQLGFEEEMPKKWLMDRLPLVKDLVVAQLQTLSSKEVTDPKTRALLRQDLLVRLNSLYPNQTPWEDPEPVKRILFQEFYRQ